MSTFTIITLMALLGSAAPKASEQAAADSLLSASLHRLECRADSGDAKALYDLAYIFETGYGPVKPDSALSLQLLEKAAAAGYAPAENYLGFRLYKGDRINPDHSRGLDLIERAALKGDPKAQANLGWLLAEGESVVPDPQKAIYWLSKAADAGLPIAMMHLADIYSTGIDSIAPDTLLASSLYSRAAAAGDQNADIRLARLMSTRWAQLDPEQAIDLGIKYFSKGNAPFSGADLFKIAADKGSARAWALLGEALAIGRGAAYNHAASVQAFYRAASMGYAPAQYIIAELLDVFPDALSDILYSRQNKYQTADVNAASWYEKASKAGINNARQAMEALYGSPDMIPPR